MRIAELVGVLDHACQQQGLSPATAMEMKLELADGTTIERCRVVERLHGVFVMELSVPLSKTEAIVDAVELAEESTEVG